MKRYLLYLILAILMVCPTQQLYANQQLSGWCEVGASVVVAPSTSGGAPVSRFFQQSYPSCNVSVYITGSGGTLATIYNSSGTQVANPFQASLQGYWSFFATNGVYDVQISGGGLASPFTYGAITAFDAGNISVSFSQITTGTLPANNVISIGLGASLDAGVGGFGSGGHVYFGAASSTWPFELGTVAQITGSTCTLGQAAFATDATAGQNLYYCTTANVWTQQLVGGSSLFSGIGSGTNTTAAMLVGSGASLGSSGNGAIDFSGGGATKPVFLGTASIITGQTCATGQVAFASDATAGQNLYFCTGTNIWTQQLNTGGGGGSAFSALSGGTNTSAAMIVGGTASIKPAGTAQIWSVRLVDELNSNLPVIEVGGFASATDYILCQNAITSNPKVACAAVGSDGNVDFVLTGKGGLGRVYVNSIAAYFDNAGNLTVNSCTGCGGGGGSTPPFTDTTYLVKGNADATKQFRIDTSTNVSTATNVVGAVPGNTNFTFAGTNLNQTFSGTNTFNGSFVSTGGMTVSGTTPSFNNGMNVSGTAAFAAVSASGNSTFSGGITLAGSLVTIDPSTTTFSTLINMSVTSTAGLGIGSGCSGGICSANGWTFGYQQLALEQSSHASLAMGNGAFVLTAPTSSSPSLTMNMNGACQLILAGTHTITLDCSAGTISLDGVPYTHP